jgi:hypothetical protein
MANPSLFNGERQILTKAANAIVRPDEHGLTRFFADQLMGVVGMQGREAIGGHLHLTSYRLLFVAHAVNRLTGSFSIFLPTIREVADTSRFITKKITVSTQTQQYDFVVWGIPALLAAIETARAAATPADRAAMREALASDARVLQQLQVNSLIEGINAALVGERVRALSADPLAVSNVLNAAELLSEE